MRSMNRAGLTLVEMLAGLALLALLGSIAAVVVRGAAWEARRTGRRSTELARSALPLPFCTRTCAMRRSATWRCRCRPRLEFAAPVGDAPLCGPAPASCCLYPTRGLVRGRWSRARRSPGAGRSGRRALGHGGGHAAADDRCPDGGGAAVRLTLAHAPAARPPSKWSSRSGLRRITPGLADWFGLAPAGPSSLQPFAGPIWHRSGRVRRPREPIRRRIHTADRGARRR